MSAKHTSAKKKKSSHTSRSTKTLPKTLVAKKKLFFLINGLEMGGAERAISNISALLADTYDITILTLKQSDAFFGTSQLPVISLSHAQTTKDMLFALPTCVKNLRELVALNPGVKLISFLDIANIVAIKGHPSPIVSMRNSPSIYPKVQKAISWLLMKYYYPKAHALVVNSAENKSLVQEWLGLPADLIRTIYNPVSLDACATKAKEKPAIDLQFVKGATVFVTVSRLESLKNIDALIDSFATYRAQERIKNPSAKSVFLIIGEGPMRSQLESRIASQNLFDSVKLLGAQKNVFPYLAIADVFVFASRTEGFPNVLLEAQAMNLPIVTTNFSSGAREVCDPSLSFSQKITYPYVGPNGILVDLRAMRTQFPVAFAQAVSLTQKKLGIERFTSEKIKKQWLALLAEVRV